MHLKLNVAGRRIRISFLAGMVVLAGGIVLRAGNIVVNGSFETPFATNATKVGFPAPAAMSPWQTTATNFEVWTNGWRNNVTGVGPLFSADGGQSLEILSTTNHATVSQVLMT